MGSRLIVVCDFHLALVLDNLYRRLFSYIASATLLEYQCHIFLN
jgi:hypothetical protein